MQAVSPLIVREFELRPDVDMQIAVATLRHVIALRDVLDRLLELLRTAREQQALGPAPHDAPDPSGFEARYLAHVARSLGRFELFGVNRGREPSRQSFDQSYVSLSVARTSDPDQSEQDGEEELTGAGVAVSTALSGRR